MHFELLPIGVQYAIVGLLLITILIIGSVAIVVAVKGVKAKVTKPSGEIIEVEVNDEDAK